MDVAPDRLEQIRHITAAHDLRIVGAVLHGDLLALVPAQLDGLPTPARCRRIAEEIKALGYRYVTLEISHGEIP